MYSQVEIVSESQLEALHCTSAEWRLNAIRMYVSTAPLIDDDRFEGGRFKFDVPPQSIDFDYLICGVFQFVSLELADFLRGRINAEFLPVDFENALGQERFLMLHM